MEPTTDHLRSLAAKLNGLEFDDGETVLLGALLAPTGDVEGYAETFEVEIKGFNIGMPPTFRRTGETAPAMKSTAKKTVAKKATSRKR